MFQSIVQGFRSSWSSKVLSDDDSSSPTSYRLIGRIVDVRQPIYAIAISPDGQMFAYGGNLISSQSPILILMNWTGKRGPEVRTLKTTTLLEVPDFYPEVYGAVTILHWLDENELLIGTALGFLVIWSESDKKFTVLARIRMQGSGEIISAASSVQGDGFRIVVGMLDCTVGCIDWCMRRGLVYMWNSWGQRSHVFIPRALSIREDGSVRVLSLHNGKMFILDRDTGDCVGSPVSFVDPIGFAAIDEKKELIAIAHSGGFTLHDPNSREGTVAVYKAEKSRTDLPKPIIFGEGRRVVVIGSDHGKAYVFNKRKGGPPIDTLVHSNDPMELVQSVAAHYDGERSIILCATSSSTAHPSISIWERTVPGRQGKRGQHTVQDAAQRLIQTNESVPTLTVWSIVQVGILLCILKFIWNMGPVEAMAGWTKAAWGTEIRSLLAALNA
ncbi:hypothetical protein GSI_14191 [Ganoderma sinense ZZ0214-1]|uniref:Uncharacterized protein n=1 Tax=Ganoderma sinense ZZ0214-1 TaxID=1077348 RepID=A0A2G8RSE9_9APHY|nr:hypothetical protein GSI_14191 [Ganoderma sinense ZZ0214-1]